MRPALLLVALALTSCRAVFEQQVGYGKGLLGPADVGAARPDAASSPAPDAAPTPTADAAESPAPPADARVDRDAASSDARAPADVRWPGDDARREPPDAAPPDDARPDAAPPPRDSGPLPADGERPPADSTVDADDDEHGEGGGETEPSEANGGGEESP
jgi:hypothetical protein